MAIIHALLLAIFRSLGRILNTAFGWATIMLFGKVSQQRQIYLSIIAFGSVLWIVTALGIAFPSVATFLLAFVTLPDWVNDNYVRLAMLISATLIPGIVGVLTIFMLDPEDRPKGVKQKLNAILAGYPYTLGLAVTLIFLTLVAPVVKVRQLAKRWSMVHIPVVVRPEHYDQIVQDVKQALTQGGIQTENKLASWTLRVPTMILTKLGGGSASNMVASNLRVLVSPGLEVLLYPADLAITGTEKATGKAHSVITERLTFTKAYLTSLKETQKLEDELREVWREAQANARGPAVQRLLKKFHEIEKRFREMSMPYDQWEALFREKLILERTLLASAAGASDGGTGAVERFLEAA